MTWLAVFVLGSWYFALTAEDYLHWRELSWSSQLRTRATGDGEAIDFAWCQESVVLDSCTSAVLWRSSQSHDQ
jgi:hypothetical protein